MTTYELLQKNADLTPTECVNLGKQYFEAVFPTFKRLYKERAIKIMRSFLFICMATDNYLSNLEYDFLVKVIGAENMYDVKKNTRLTNHNTDEIRNIYRDVCNQLTLDEKKDLVALAGAAILCDYGYSKEDAEVIDYLFCLN